MATKYVTVNGNDLTGDGSEALPYAKPSKVLSVGNDGDTCQIGAGTFEEATYLTYNKAIVLDGASILSTILQSLNSSRIVYINNAKERIISDLTLENTSTTIGPANLVETSGAGTDINTILRRVYLHDGRTGGIRLATGDFGLTIDDCTILVDINTTSQVLDMLAPTGYVTIQDSDFTITSGANASMNGIIRLSVAVVAGILKINRNVFNVDKGVYVLRLGLGGFDTGSEINDNDIFITATSYTRPVFELGNFEGVASCIGNYISILAETLSSTPIQIRSTVGAGPNCVWTIENNVIETRNVDNYGIILGDEGGDINSKKGAFNGSIIRGNIIKSGNYYGLAIGAIHSIMTGGNKNLFIENNIVYNGGYGNVLKGDDTWTDGYVKGNKYINCVYGVYPKGQKNIRVINNTFVGDNGNVSKCILPGDKGDGTYATGTIMKNNIFKISSGYAIYVEANCQTGIQIDYNLYYLSGTAKAAMINGVEYATLSALQAAGYDTHGVNGNPLLNSENSTDASSPAFEKGVAITGVTVAKDVTNTYTITLAGNAGFSMDVPYRKRVLVS